MIVINKDVKFWVAVVNDVWCATYEPYWWNLCYFISCGRLYFTFWKEKKKRKSKLLHMSGANTTKTVKIEKQNSIKLSTLRFSVPFTFSTNKNVGAAFFIMSHQWWWYARNKNATKITDQFHQALNAYLYTHFRSTRHSISVLWGWVLMRYIIYTYKTK